MKQEILVGIASPTGRHEWKTLTTDEDGLAEVEAGKSILITHDHIAHIPVTKPRWYRRNPKKIPVAIVPAGKSEPMQLANPESPSEMTMEKLHDIDHDQSLLQLKESLKELEQGATLEQVKNWVIIATCAAVLLLSFMTLMAVNGGFDDVMKYLVWIKPPPPPPPPVA